MKRYRSWIIIVGIVAILAAATPKILWIAEINRYARNVREANDLIISLQDRRPPECPADIWEHAATWSSIAFCNIFFSPEHASHAELQKFAEELRSEVEGEVNLELFDWIWDRLEVTGIHGKRYVDRFRSAYEEPLHKFNRSDAESGGFRPKAIGTELPLVTSRKELDRHLDRLVAIRGVVSQSKIPQIIGVDVNVLDDQLRGGDAYAVGILRKWTVSQEEIDAIGEHEAHRGAGDFYAIYFDLSGKLARSQALAVPSAKRVDIELELAKLRVRRPLKQAQSIIAESRWVIAEGYRQARSILRAPLA